MIDVVNEISGAGLNWVVTIIIILFAANGLHLHYRNVPCK